VIKWDCIVSGPSTNSGIGTPEKNKVIFISDPLVIIVRAKLYFSFECEFEAVCVSGSLEHAPSHAVQLLHREYLCSGFSGSPTPYLSARQPGTAT
jgi:hypothetical protein